MLLLECQTYFLKFWFPLLRMLTKSGPVILFLFTSLKVVFLFLLQGYLKLSLARLYSLCKNYVLKIRESADFRSHLS